MLCYAYHINGLARQSLSVKRPELEFYLGSSAYRKGPDAVLNEPMRAKMTIRPCLAPDAAGIELLFREFVAYLRSIGDENDYRFSAQQYLTDGFGSDPAFRGFVAETSSGLIGYVLFSRSYDGDYVRTLYVVDLYVQQASRGKGVGRALMNAVRNVALAERVTRLSWAVHKKNAGALRFYKALGARYASDAHVMHLDLSHPK
jgi:GNAT superfamily N-acetyltransferase